MATTGIVKLRSVYGVANYANGRGQPTPRNGTLRLYQRGRHQREAPTGDRLRRDLSEGRSAHRSIERLGVGVGLNPKPDHPEGTGSLDGVAPEELPDARADAIRIDKQEPNLAVGRITRQGVEPTTWPLESATVMRSRATSSACTVSSTRHASMKSRS
jgi:hypothetical protein